MYEQFYGLAERPFSITPDPRFVYLSQRHQDAMAHLLYGIGRGGSGGFVQVTGEVGTGKTTLCRLLLEQVPEQTRIALILNPVLTPSELLRAVCRELGVDMQGSDGGLEDLGQRLNTFLLSAHAAGQRVVLIIDEAQTMSRESLEQIRLLTNLETATDKLLQIILLGQPELRELLSRPSLRQLAQRITARYHLDPLERGETEQYVRHRLAVAGAQRCPFTPKALRTLHRVSGGVPRLINIIADRALMAGYAREADRITPKLVRAAAAEVIGGASPGRAAGIRPAIAAGAVVAVLGGGLTMLWLLASVGTPVDFTVPEPAAALEAETLQPVAARPLWQTALQGADAEQAYQEMAALWPALSGPAIGAACAGAPSPQVVCQRLNGGLDRIRRIGLPVILELTEPAGARLVLVGLSAEAVTIRSGGLEYRMPRNQLERRWAGAFWLSWPDNGDIFLPGTRLPEVRQLKLLAAADPVQPWEGPVDEEYDEAFAAWVARFQRRHAIAADGLLGPVSRLFLRASETGDVRLRIEDGSP